MAKKEYTMKTNALRFTSAMLAIIMLAIIMLALCFCFGGNTATAEEQSKPIVVIAGSDFQASTPDISADNVKTLLNAVKTEGYNEAHGFLFGGDLGNDYDAKNDELALLKNTVKDVYPAMADDKMVFVQGNHDGSDTKGLTKSGPNDTEHYGVFVIPEDNYMWYNANELIIKNTANVLDVYLKQKAQSGYDKPIFVISHIPLHYCHRTTSSGDGKFACYFVETMNKYGDDLNIIFLFGHNHSSAYDDYIGGSNIYLAKGDTMYVSKKNKQKEVPDAVELKFTYMNTGYVGYTNCLTNTLTLTVFEIDGTRVKIRRISANGEVDLKAKGAWSANYSETAAVYGADDSYLDISYSSPQYLCNKAVNGKVTVFADGIDSLDVTEKTDSHSPELHSAFASYDIKAVGTPSNIAAIQFKIGKDFKESRPIFVRDKATGEMTTVYAKNGIVTIETDKISSYELSQSNRTTISEESATIYELTTSLSDGQSYMILSSSGKGEAFVLNHGNGGLTAEKAEIAYGYNDYYVKNPSETAIWTFEKSSGYPDVYGALKNTATGAYLTAPNGNELAVSDTLPAEYSSFRLSSGAYGLFTVKSGSDYATRYYLKHKDGFVSSDSQEGSYRVFLFGKTVKPLKITATVDTAVGSVEKGADGSAKTGSKLYVLGSDGSEQVIDVTVSMLRAEDGSEIGKLRKGAYNNISVVYNGTVVYNKYALFVDTEAVYPVDWTEDTFNNGNPVLVIILVAIGALAVIGGACAVIIIKKKKAKA